MLRSKSRSGSFDFRQSSNSSIFSRTISASKFCRGDALGSQIDADALVSLDRKPSKTESGINRVIVMQQQKMGEIEEELRDTKEQLGFVEEERNRALKELREIKEVVQELKTLKDLLSSTQEELKAKDRNIELLTSELGKAKELEIKLAERDASLERLKEELGDAARDLLEDQKRRIQELEDEIERRKLSESKALDSLESQRKESVQNKNELEEHKQRILLERIHLLENKSSDGDLVNSLKEELEMVKNELNLATDAEEKSRKAMDDLALALKEVAMESAEAKEKQHAIQLELDEVKEEANKLKEMVRNTEERCEKLLEEANKETELQRNTVERLRSEAEESLLAWNGKEMGFVTCIKRGEEERALAQHEATRLAEALKSAEHMTRAAREETYKLRDILKQAVNEANAAKSAADIARAENSQLKDLLADKDEALHFLSRENERLRINEAAANENVKQFKLMLSYVSQELKAEEKDHEGGLKTPNTDSELEHEEEDDEDEEDDEEEAGHLQQQYQQCRKVDKKFSFDLSELALLKEDDEYTRSRNENEDPEKAEALKGSIFDTPYSPKSEPRTPKQQPPAAHHRRKSTTFADAEGSPSAEYSDLIDSHQIDESDSEKNSHRRKKALFRRVGDLLLRRSFSIRKEPTPGPPPSPVLPQPSPAPP